MVDQPFLLQKLNVGKIALWLECCWAYVKLRVSFQRAWYALLRWSLRKNRKFVRYHSIRQLREFFEAGTDFMGYSMLKTVDDKSPQLAFPGLSVNMFCRAAFSETKWLGNLIILRHASDQWIFSSLSTCIFNLYLLHILLNEFFRLDRQTAGNQVRHVKLWKPDTVMRLKAVCLAGLLVGQFSWHWIWQRNLSYHCYFRWSHRLDTWSWLIRYRFEIYVTNMGHFWRAVTASPRIFLCEA